MFARQTDVNISPMADGVLLAIYFVVAVLVFGVAVPAGNFIPGMTIGAALGRTFGEVPAPPFRMRRTLRYAAILLPCATSSGLPSLASPSSPLPPAFR